MSPLQREALKRFHQVAYQPSLRQEFVADLLSDPVLLDLARVALTRMADVIAARGSLADHVTTTTQACLVEALRQVDAAAPNDISIRQEAP